VSGHRWAAEVELIPLDEMIRRIEAVRDQEIRAEQGKKRCGGPCGELRSLRAFSIARGRPDGRCSNCQLCERARKKAWRSRQALQAIGETTS
jgi:hypothetical protein